MLRCLISSSALHSSHVLQTAAAVVGKLIAELALAKGITLVAFDRGGFNYHGRVQVCGKNCSYFECLLGLSRVLDPLPCVP